MDFALDGYQVNSIDYLLKPVQRELLKAALLRAWKRHRKQRILLSTSNQTISLYLDHILYVEILDKTLTIHTTDGGSLHAVVPLNVFSKNLPPDQFIRCHKSYVVALSAISSVWRYSIELTNHEIIPVSKKNYKAVLDALISWSEQMT